MDRETYLLGRSALKTTIKELAFLQSRDKAILRMPRGTEENLDAIEAALGEAGYSLKYGVSLGSIQAKCWFRRQEITAYLTVYAEIRKKPNAHPPGHDYYGPTYTQYLNDARRLFESAVSPTPVA